MDENQMREVAAKFAASGEAVTATLLAHERLVLIAETKGAYLDRRGTGISHADKRRYAPRQGIAIPSPPRIPSLTP